MIDTPELLRLAIEKHGSLSAVARKAAIFRSTLKRIKNGDTKAPHTETVAKLVRLLNWPKQ